MSWHSSPKWRSLEDTCVFPIVVHVKVDTDSLGFSADAFPILRKLPDLLAPWRTEGRRLHDWYANAAVVVTNIAH